MNTSKVFISSTFYDGFQYGFKEERKALKEKLNKIFFTKDISLDYGEPDALEGSEEKSLQRVESCDLMILLLGTVYGSIRGDGLSLTHKEYLKAKELKKPVLIYIFPRDERHEDCARIEKFIDDIKNSDDQISCNVIDLLPEKYAHNVFLCKKGEVDVNMISDETVCEYCTNLVDIIAQNIERIREKITYTLPVGVQEIFDKEESLSYKKYLSNRTLPYISRSEFKAYKGITESFQTEDDFFNAIFAKESKRRGSLISGEGGVGKTRLMLELARRAQQNGWTTYQVFPEFRGWEFLKLNTASKYCLIFDYIEENKHFSDDIFEILNRRYQDIDIRIIANARNTYFLNNEIDLRVFDTIDFSSSNKYERSYTSYVVEKILCLNGVDGHSYGIALEKYINKPSFAIFLIEGMLKRQDIDFRDVDGFSGYIRRRLYLTLHKEKFIDIEPSVFSFLCSLPSKNIPAHLQEVADRLEQDGWIELNEQDGAFRSSYNDTIMDEILIGYLGKQLFKLDRNLKRELVAIFSFAIEHSRFENAFRAFDRIISQSILGQKQTILYEVMEIFIDEIKHIPAIFAKSAILSYTDRLKLTTTHEILDCGSFDYAILLSHAMKNCASDDYKFVADAFDVWMSLPDTPSKYDDYFLGSFLLTSFYNFFNDDEQKRSEFRIDERSVNWLNTHSTYIHADYVISAYLESGAEPWRISDCVDRWLSYHKKNDSFTFIVKRYLNNGGPLSSIAINVQNWINDNPIDPAFPFMATQYLQNGGCLSPIEMTLRYWMLNNNESEGFPYVLKLYLKHGEPSAEITDAIHSWINRNDHTSAFSHIIVPFLQHCKDLSPVHQAIINWINNNIASKFFPNVVLAYVYREGKIKPIQESVESWIKHSPENRLFPRMVITYLTYGGTTEPIQDIVHEWLIENHNQKSMPHVISYLKNRGLLSSAFNYEALCGRSEEQHLVSTQELFKHLSIRGTTLTFTTDIQEWLINSPSDINFPHVLRKYLERGGSLAPVEEAIQSWINSCSDSISFNQIVPLYLKIGGSLQPIEHTLQTWLNDPNKFKRGFVLSAYLENGGKLHPIRDSVQSWIENNIDSVDFPYIVSSYLNHKGRLKPILGHVTEWIGKSIDHNGFPIMAKAYLEKHGAIELVQDSIIKWINTKQTNIAYPQMASCYLSYKGSIAPIQNSLESWINNNETSQGFCSIATRFIANGGSFLPVQATLERWFKNNPNSPWFTHLFTAYIDACGPMNPSLISMQEWINSNIDSPNFPHVVEAYLDRRCSIHPISDAVSKWINLNISSDRFSHLVASYYDAQGDSWPILDTVQTWIMKMKDSPGFPHIVPRYLAKDGPIDPIQSSVQAWLNTSVDSAGFPHVAPIYLERGGQLEPVLTSLQRWIYNNTSSNGFPHVVSRYILQGGPIPTIQDTIQKWIIDNHNSSGFSRIVKLFLDSGGSLVHIENNLAEWINSNLDSYGFPYIVECYINGNGEYSSVSDSIHSWLNSNIDSHGFPYIICALFERGISMILITPILEKWLEYHLDSPFYERIYGIHSEICGSDIPSKQLNA